MISRNRWCSTAVVGLVLMFGSGFASAQQMKIAVVNSSAVVQQSPEYKAAAQQMKSEFSKRRSQIEQEGKKLQADIQAYQKNADVMTSNERVKKENSLLARENDLKYEQKKFQEDFQKREQQLSQNLMGRIKSVIEKIAKEKGYSLVIQDPVYAIPSIDITKEVLKRLKSGSGKH